MSTTLVLLGRPDLIQCDHCKSLLEFKEEYTANLWNAIDDEYSSSNSGYIYKQGTCIQCSRIVLIDKKHFTDRSKVDGIWLERQERVREEFKQFRKMKMIQEKQDKIRELQTELMELIDETEGV